MAEALVDINTCSKEELRSLPGIGPSIANYIVKLRARQIITREVFDNLPYLKAHHKESLIQIIKFGSTDSVMADNRSNYPFQQSGEQEYYDPRDYYQDGSVQPSANVPLVPSSSKGGYSLWDACS